MDAGVGLRERKKGETRRAIADAALDLALRHGPAEVTVEDIAAAAGVSPRTVFNHFATKDAAILGVDPERRQELLRALEDRPSGEAPLEALRRTLAAFHSPDRLGRWRDRVRLARRYPELHTAYVAAFTELEGDLTTVIGRRTGIDPDADPYPLLVVAVMAAAMRVSLTHAAAADADPAQLERILDQAFASLSAGLPAPC